jgi:hypothetical protein
MWEDFMHAFIKILTAAATTVLIGVPAGAATATEGPAPRLIDGVSVDVPGVDSSADLQVFLSSGRPKSVAIDAVSGDILAVSAGPAASRIPVVGGACAEAKACLYGAGDDIDLLIAGEGTVHGRWENRSGYASGPYNMWVTLDSGQVFDPYGPWTQVVFWSQGVYYPQTITDVSLSLAWGARSAS